VTAEPSGGDDQRDGLIGIGCQFDVVDDAHLSPRFGVDEETLAVAQPVVGVETPLPMTGVDLDGVRAHRLGLLPV
jgi:hypothetical protein